MIDQYEGKIRTKEFKIVTCICYFSEWDKIKKDGVETWKFDEIEKNNGKKLRKVFIRNMLLFHCCHNCLEKIIIENPFIIEPESLAGHCIMKRFLNAIASIDDICNGCLHFFISKFEDKFNVV